MNNDKKLHEKKAIEQLEKGYTEAETLLNDNDKLEDLLQRLEKKFSELPKVGDKLAMIPVMVSLVRNYIKKEYTDIPKASIVAIISALIYFLSPIDLLPDSIPGVGYIDDALVVMACLKIVEIDIDKYNEWRKLNNKIIS